MAARGPSRRPPWGRALALAALASLWSSRYAAAQAAPSPSAPSSAVLPASAPPSAPSSTAPSSTAPPAPSAGAPQPADSGASSGDGASGCSAFDQLRGLCREGEGASESKSWRVIGRVDAIRKVVVDDDPANDAAVLWRLGGEVDLPVPVPGFYATGFVGFDQSFAPEPDESSLQLADTLVAAGYRHGVSLARLGLPEHSAQFVHRVGFYLPTSRQSQAQDLYATLDWISALRVNVAPGTLVGANLRNQYHFHEYAERAGTEGGLNDRWTLEGVLLGQQRVYEHPGVGQFFASAELGTRYRVRYPSRDAFESASSDQAPTYQDWIWGLGATYVPIRELALTLAFGQDTPLLHQGIRRGAFGDRDELEWTLRVTGVY